MINSTPIPQFLVLDFEGSSRTDAKSDEYSGLYVLDRKKSKPE